MCTGVVWQPGSGPGSAQAASCPVVDLAAQRIFHASEPMGMWKQHTSIVRIPLSSKKTFDRCAAIA